MNNDLISREAVAEWLKDEFVSLCFNGDDRMLRAPEQTLGDMLKRLKEFAVIDAERVRHAYWIKMVWSDSSKFAGYKCSECGRGAKRKYPYCHCGAKMDLEAQNEK